MATNTVLKKTKNATDATLNRKTDFRIFPVTPDLYAYRSEVVWSSDKGAGFACPPSVTEEGFVNKKQAALGLSGKPFTSDQRYLIIDEKGRDIIRHNTYGSEEQTSYMKNNVPQDPYTALSTGQSLPEDVIRFDWGSHLYFYADGRPMSQALQLNYLSGHLDNGHYDLRKAAEHLMSRDDVTVYGGNNNRSREPLKKANTVDEAIHSIPYYNSENNRDLNLIVIWSPSQDDYEKLHAACQEMTTNYPWGECYRAIFEKDLLWLRAAGAALFESYYTSRERDTNDYDDEDDMGFD